MHDTGATAVDADRFFQVIMVDGDQDNKFMFGLLCVNGLF